MLSVQDRKVYVANTEMKSSFLRPSRSGDVLTCTATVLKPGKVVAFLQARVLDDREPGLDGEFHLPDQRAW